MATDGSVGSQERDSDKHLLGRGALGNRER